MKKLSRSRRRQPDPLVDVARSIGSTLGTIARTAGSVAKELGSTVKQSAKAARRQAPRKTRGRKSAAAKSR